MLAVGTGSAVSGVSDISGNSGVSDTTVPDVAPGDGVASWASAGTVSSKVPIRAIDTTNASNARGYWIMVHSLLWRGAASPPHGVVANLAGGPE
jgi:hypothetical protein